MVVTISSKGQLVIPKKIRQELDLQSGAKVNVELVGNEIILRPVQDKKAMKKAVASLYGMIATGPSPLDKLEAEHRQEIERDERRKQSFSSR